jgi:glycosyltransferase involved in cell wall biosynthesis
MDEIARSALARHARTVEIVAHPDRSRVERLRAFAMSRQPDLVRRLWSDELVERLARLLRAQSFDLVQIEGLEMYAFWESVATSLARGPVVILDAHNAEYVLQEGAWRASLARRDWVAAAYSLVQARRLRRYERLVCQSAGGVVAVSREDEAALLALAPRLNSAVVPNGVDTRHYHPSLVEPDGTSALFIGKLDYRPNVDAVEWLATDVWPLVLEAQPRAKLFVVGRDPLPRVRQLGHLAGVTVVGPVPDERPWFSRSSCLVVPMRMGGGVRLKVLQAMAMGTPVVSTGVGMAGVAAQPGSHYLRGDTPQELAAGVVKTLQDAPLRHSLAQASRDLACSSYDWQVILPRLDEFYRVCTEAS